MILFLGAMALLASTGTAHAAPLIAPIVAAVLPFLSAAAVSVVSSLIVAGISLGVSYLLRPKQPKEQEGGVELDTSFDPLHPQTLIVGRAVTGGSMVYRETYGNTNQNLIEIFALADHPCEGLVTQFVEGQEVELTDTGGNRGFTVDGYSSKLAVRFFDGSQTTADAYVTAALSGHADRPWTSNHIGRTRACARAHYVYDREKLPGPLPWKFVVDGIKLYDPRLDTTVGGSGAHRFADLDTHEFTANLAVIAYNILRGIRVENEFSEIVHFYGLEGTPAANLPLDNWFAAMNEADVAISLTPSGTEPQFHGGLEITVSMEPLEALKEILKATGGRVTEVGGVYKLYLGAPGLPSATFDDGVIPANRSDLFEPIRPLEQQTTFITGSFVSPADGWIEKAPPPRVDADRETAIGRRIESSLSAPMIQSGAHIQRVMKQILARVGRERRHSLPLPPSLFGVEPGDVLEWTSNRNGYTDKLFEVEAAEIDANLISTAHLLEIDAADYDWETADEIAQATGSLTQSRPDPKIIDGFAANGFLHEGDTGAQRAAISLTWTPPDDDDITGIALQIRRASEPLEIVTLPSIDDREGVEAGQVIILSGLAPATAYEVRARFKSFGGWATDWSLWIPVTTPDVRITQEDLDTNLDALIRQTRDALPADILTVRADLDAIVGALAAHVSTIMERLGQINIGVGARYGENKATAELALSAAANANSSIAAFLVGLFAENANGEAEGLIRFVAAALPDGAVASFALEVRASFEAEFASAGLYFDVGAFDGGISSRFRLVGAQGYFDNGQGLIIPVFLLSVQDEPEIVPIDAGDIVVDTSSRLTAYETLIDAAAVYRMPLTAKPGFVYQHELVMDGAGGHAVTFDSNTLFGTPPTIDGTPDAINLIEVRVRRGFPPKFWARLLDVDFDAPPAPLTFVDDYQPAVSSGSGFSFNPIATAGGQAGEIMIFCVRLAKSAAESPPALSALTGWTQLATGLTSFGGGQRVLTAVYARRLDGSENSSLQVSASTSFLARALTVLRFAGGRGSITPGMWVLNATSTGKPADVDVNVVTAGVALPHIIIGFARAAATYIWTPTQEASIAGVTDGVRARYQIYNIGDTPANQNIDVSVGGGSNHFNAGGYLRIG